MQKDQQIQKQGQPGVNLRNKTETTGDEAVVSMQQQQSVSAQQSIANNKNNPVVNNKETKPDQADAQNVTRSGSQNKIRKDRKSNKEQKDKKAAE